MGRGMPGNEGMREYRHGLQARTYPISHILKHTHVYLCTLIQVRINIKTHTQINYTCTYVRMQTYAYMFMYICINAYI